jgi:class 3 adenylate cyclase
LFTDLEGFTALVERSAPTVVVPLLNEYLDGMIRIAFKHDGTVDKIVGDALHVIFGAPVAQPDHAERALACALDIDAFARAFAAEKQRQGIAFGQTRIGVNSGTAIVGNFGGELRFDYTAHGDAINTAARLESVNKQLGTRIVVSGDTVALCRQFTGRPVGALVLKGKTQGIQVFEPLPAEAVTSPSVASYLKAYALLEANDGAAVDAFTRLVANHPDDGLAAFHLRRLQRGERGTTVMLTEK